MAAAAILQITKITIYGQRFDRPLRNLVRWCKMGVITAILIRSSAVAEGPRDARNSIETTCPTSTEQIEVMKFDGYSGAMCNKHVYSTMTWSSRFHCPIGVINKPTKGELWISPVYRRLAVAKFSKSTMYKLLTWPWPRPLSEHSLITRLRLHMADPGDPCTKFEVSIVSRCGDITWGVKF